MRRVWFALAVVVLLSTGQAAFAVDLQEGWYVRYEYVTLRGMDTPYHEWASAWYPLSSLGQSDYLLTQQGTDQWSRGRTVTITHNVSVNPGVIYEDVGSYTTLDPYFQSVTMEWYTNYDADALQLQVFRRRSGFADELVWKQTKSGAALSADDIWNYSSPLLNGEQVVFKLVVVPEPAGLSALAGVLLLSWTCCKRRVR